MAIAKVSTVVTMSTGTGVNPMILTVGAGGAAAGNFVVIALGLGANSITFTTIVDTKANTWQFDGAASGGTKSCLVASSKLTTALVSGDTITITLSSLQVVQRAGVYEFSGMHPTTWLDKTISATASTASPSSGNLGTTKYSEMIFQVCTYNSGGGAFTTGSTGGFSFVLLDDLAASSTRCHTDYALVSGSNVYTANGTITSASWLDLGVTYIDAVQPQPLALGVG